MSSPPGSTLGLRAWLDHEARATWGHDRDIAILAVDGLGYAEAVDVLRPSSARCAETVFPTSSFPGWLSALTGTNVATHGVPGVVFRDPASGDPVNVLRDQYRPPWSGETVFTDAHQRHEAGFAILNDLSAWQNGVTGRMLAGAILIPGMAMFRRPSPVGPHQANRLLRTQICEARASASGRRCLVWTFVELDHHMHRSGFDYVSEAWLHALQRLAEDLVSDRWVVILHSDHGLIETTHVPELRDELESLAARVGGGLGGAGRTSWVGVPNESAIPSVISELQALFGGLADVLPREAVFDRGSAGWRAVGDVLVVARGTECATPDDAPYEHGSRTLAELQVPIMTWEP